MSSADMQHGAVVAAPRLLDQVRQRALAHFGRGEPGERYAEWVRRFVLFCDKRHPRELGAEDVGRFLKHVGETEKADPLRWVEQAHEGLTFLYQEVLQVEVVDLPFPEPPRLLDRVRRALRVRHRAAGTPLDLLAELTPEAIEAAAAASWQLQGGA